MTFKIYTKYTAIEPHWNTPHNEISISLKNLVYKKISLYLLEEKIHCATVFHTKLLKNISKNIEIKWNISMNWVTAETNVSHVNTKYILTGAYFFPCSPQKSEVRSIIKRQNLKKWTAQLNKATSFCIDRLIKRSLKYEKIIPKSFWILCNGSVGGISFPVSYSSISWSVTPIFWK